MPEADRSQSLIHQVSVSDSILRFWIYKVGDSSQSLIHQVSVSDNFTGRPKKNWKKSVSIPYSSGLSFRCYLTAAWSEGLNIESQSLIHQVSVSDTYI